MPRRYQRKRNVSADIPAEAIYVGRPTKWGNPFPVNKPRYNASFLAEAREIVVRLYREWLDGQPHLLADARTELRGKDLVCWCPLDQPCHADVLLELANR
jgi:Domain of unknown function (DUF4326)